MEQIKQQTVIIANEATKKIGYSVPEGFTGKMGYFFTEAQLRVLLEDAFSDGATTGENQALGIPEKSRKQYNSPEEYANEILSK
jgi:hypothetical protein